MNTSVEVQSSYLLRNFATTLSGVVMAAGLMACATVKIEAPEEPIEINLNVKVEQEVRIKMDKEIEEVIANNPDIF